MHFHASLQKQVVFCDTQLGLERLEEATAIGDYLNDSFYEFKKQIYYLSTGELNMY